MLTAIIAIFAALAGVQAVLVIKLADFLTEGADGRSAATDVGRARVA